MDSSVGGSQACSEAQDISSQRHGFSTTLHYIQESESWAGHPSPYINIPVYILFIYNPYLNLSHHGQNH